MPALNRQPRITCSFVLWMSCRQLRTLAAAHPGVQVAVSLNATTDASRTALMPVNRRWPLAVLMEALREVFPADHRRSGRLARRTHVFLEYIMLQVTAAPYVRLVRVRKDFTMVTA